MPAVGPSREGEHMPDNADTADTDTGDDRSDVDEDVVDETPVVDYESEAKKWKALARKHEARAKANVAAARRVEELENEGKSEAEKLSDRASAAEERANAAEQRALRLEVAAAKGLSPAQAKRLVGTSREELEADADELLETFGTSAKPDKAGSNGAKHRPRENLRPGASSEEDLPISREQASKIAASIESGGF